MTRREIMLLSDILGRIPQTHLTGNMTDLDQPLVLTVIDESSETPMLTTSSQGEVGTFMPTEELPQTSQTEHVVGKGKRRRPKYSLTGAMLKKHPVLKFSATGPLDKEKSPYKWWCRFCKVELSLMSRGILELVSHYRSETHLVKEHRIRMGIPGMALYDREERELLGESLQEAKKKAKDTFPIAPQLDSCRHLVGQKSVPDFSAVITPTEKILSQVTVLELGLRHGGHIDSLTGIYSELARLATSNRMCDQN